MVHQNPNKRKLVVCNAQMLRTGPGRRDFENFFFLSITLIEYISLKTKIYAI